MTKEKNINEVQITSDGVSVSSNKTSVKELVKIAVELSEKTKDFMIMKKLGSKPDMIT